jgi:cyclase
MPIMERDDNIRSGSMPRVAAIAFTVAIVAFALPASAQQNIDFSKVEIKTIDLGHSTYRLEGQGGNITVAVGSDGIIMVDGQFAPLHDKIRAAIAAISPLPIKYLINTHFHGDHTGGNEAFQKDGAIVVAQDNIRVRLAAGTTNGITQDGAGGARRIAEANLYRRFDDAGGRRPQSRADTRH